MSVAEVHIIITKNANVIYTAHTPSSKKELPSYVALVSRLSATIFMPPTSKKLRGHIGLIMSVCLSVRYALLPTRYLKNHVRYEADIWYTVSLPYEDVLINF